MIKKNLVILLTALSISVGLQGCMQPPATNTATNENTNLSKTGNANLDNSAVNDSNKSGINTAPNGNSLPKTNNNAVSKGPAPTPSIGSGGSDLAILMQARGKLSSEKDLINSVVVEVKDGNTTLTGKVSSQEQKKKAEDLVKSTQGVKSVKNNLTVSP